MFNSVRRRDLSAMAAASLLLGPSVLSASNLQRVSIALAARGTLYHLPLMLADQLGFFKAEGLHIEWVECDSGLQATQAASNGLADVVSGDFGHVIDLQAQGQNVVAFVAQCRTPQISLGLVSKRAIGMKSVADLKTLRMGISSVGSATHWIALHWLRQAGLASDAVQFVELGGSTTAVMEGVRSGLVEALCHVDPIIHYLEQKHDFRVLADTRNLMSSQRMLSGIPVSACLFAKDEFLKKHTGAAQILASGVLRALNWLKTAGPSDILQTVPSQHWMGDRAVYLGAFEKVRDSFSLDGLFYADAVQSAWRARQGRMSMGQRKPLTMKPLFTNQFVKVIQRRPSAS